MRETQYISYREVLYIVYSFIILLASYDIKIFIIVDGTIDRSCLCMARNYCINTVSAQKRDGFVHESTATGFTPKFFCFFLRIKWEQRHWVSCPKKLRHNLFFFLLWNSENTCEWKMKGKIRKGCEFVNTNYSYVHDFSDVLLWTYSHRKTEMGWILSGQLWINRIHRNSTNFTNSNSVGWRTTVLVHCFHMLLSPYTNWYTVKPVYSDHPRETKNVAFIHKWLLYTGSYTDTVSPWESI